MKYFAWFLRLALLAMAIKLLVINWFVAWSTETCLAIALIIVFIYFAIIAKFGIEAVSCPFCKDGNCSIKK